MRAAVDSPAWPANLGDMWHMLNDMRHKFALDIAATMPDDWTKLLPEYDYSFALEHVPSAVAWIVVVSLAIFLCRLVCVHRPRLSLFSAFVWLAWLTWDVACVHGTEALVMAKTRGADALVVTGKFTQVLVELVRAWTHFFMPFMNDLARWAAQVWDFLTLRQRLGLGCFILAGYGVVVTVQSLWRHQRFVKKVIFQMSFLLLGPGLWHLCGVIPQDWYSTIVMHAVTTVPTILSMATLYCAPSDVEVRPRSGRGDVQREDADYADTVPTTNQQWLRLCISYWTCWPVLSVIKVLVERVPRLVGSTGMATGIAHAAQLQSELQRAMITFVAWLLIWQGSQFLNWLLRACFFDTGIWKNIAWFFGAHGFEALIAAKGGISGAVLSFSPIKMGRIIGKIQSRLWLVGLVFFLAVSLVCLLLWVFYSAVSIVSQLLTMLLWVFAALDSADALTHQAEGFYYRKLAFWVLAMIWEVVVALPYAGVVLNIFTPIAFALFFVAGEFLLKRVVLPVAVRANQPVGLLVRTVRRAACPKKGGAGSDNGGGGAGSDAGGDNGQQEPLVAGDTPRTVAPMMSRLLGKPSPRDNAAKDTAKEDTRNNGKGPQSPRSSRKSKRDSQASQRSEQEEAGATEKPECVQGLPEVISMSCDKERPPDTSPKANSMGTKAKSSESLAPPEASAPEGAEEGARSRSNSIVTEDASPTRKTSGLLSETSSPSRRSLKTGTKGKKGR